MRVSCEICTIQLNRPFRIAHGSSLTRDTVLVSVHEGEFIGRGEGALVPYYPSRSKACVEWIDQIMAQWSCDPGAPLSEQIGSLPPAPEDAAAARAAWEIALHDLWAQRRGVPLWKAWGLDRENTPRCARTIPIPVDENELRELLAEGGGCFKLKAGSGDPDWDLRCLELTREFCPSAQVSVDANEGWSIEDAVRLIPQMATRGVEYIEQPVGKHLEVWRELRLRLGDFKAAPLVADESLQRSEDIPALRGLADGVNVKLLKTGGLAGAREWISRARSAGLHVMVGVMVETGIGRTAAAQLAPLADWLDIDPPDSIPTHPLRGFEVEGDRLVLSMEPGLGLRSV